MNFLGHAHVATWFTATPTHALGAMLPDFCAIAGVRLASTTDPELSRGLALHHATDDAFHGAAEFIALCRDGIAALAALGVDPGRARAVAHIGTELMLDAELVGRPATRDLYLAALSDAPAVLGTLTLRSGAHPERLAPWIRRLEAHGPPLGYGDDDFVRERVVGALAPRPRLALTADEAAALSPWVAGHRPLVRAAAGALLDRTRSSLAAVSLPLPWAEPSP